MSEQKWMQWLWSPAFTHIIVEDPLTSSLVREVSETAWV